MTSGADCSNPTTYKQSPTIYKLYWQRDTLWCRNCWYNADDANKLSNYINIIISHAAVVALSFRKRVKKCNGVAGWLGCWMKKIIQHSTANYLLVKEIFV